MEIKTIINNKEITITLTKEQLEEINKQTAKKKMRPEVGYTWFELNSDGEIYERTWDDNKFDNNVWNQRNGFFTEEEAEFESQKRIYMKQYKDWCKEKPDELDWEDLEDYYKWYCFYDFSENKININFTNHKIQGVIYASSEEIIKDFIREIGKDNFKKYILGV